MSLISAISVPLSGLTATWRPAPRSRPQPAEPTHYPAPDQPTPAPVREWIHVRRRIQTHEPTTLSERAARLYADSGAAPAERSRAVSVLV